jgi:uncharacterized protein with HEPN domain
MKSKASVWPFAAFLSRSIRRAICIAGRLSAAAQIVSEATRALPPDVLARYADAPWSSIIGIGNILRHEYQRLDDKQLWEIATVHMPKLEPVVARMLAEFDE